MIHLASKDRIGNQIDFLIGRMDRLFFVSIMKMNPRVILNLITIKPSTVISWHTKLVQKKWDYSKNRLGRPAITDEIKNLILEMKSANSRWGRRKINGELRKLGLKVEKSTIAKILKAEGYLPGNTNMSVLG